MAAAQTHRGTNRAGISGWFRPSSPPAPPCAEWHIWHTCSAITKPWACRGLGGRLSAWEPSHWKSRLPQDTHSHQRQLSMPECQWQLQRSCRCRPPRCPSSPPPQRTGARCKAPWSARAWLGKRSRQERFPGEPLAASPALHTPGQGQDGHAGEKDGNGKGNGEVPSKEQRPSSPGLLGARGHSATPHPQGPEHTSPHSPAFTLSPR